MRLTVVTILSAVLLAGCTTTKEPTLIKPSLTVVMPPEEFFNTCRPFTNFPNPDTLKDDEVARLVVALYKNGATCYETVQAIRKYLESAKASIESQNS